MTQDIYITLQIANIENAIHLGEKALRTARTLQDFSKADDSANEFAEDTLKYFSFSDAANSIESMPLQLKDFKNEMIEIKIANDKMLLEGGFIPGIDKEIAEVFLNHTLCKMDPLDPNTITAIEDALAILKRLKEELKK